eukprot:3073758-Ditylum_brightwellii.AAC.1
MTLETMVDGQLMTLLGDFNFKAFTGYGLYYFLCSSSHRYSGWCSCGTQQEGGYAFAEQAMDVSMD